MNERYKHKKHPSSCPEDKIIYDKLILDTMYLHIYQKHSKKTIINVTLTFLFAVTKLKSKSALWYRNQDQD